VRRRRRNLDSRRDGARLARLSPWRRSPSHQPAITALTRAGRCRHRLESLRRPHGYGCGALEKRPDIASRLSRNLIRSVSNRAPESQLSCPSPQLGRPAANPALTPSVLTAPRLVYLHAPPPCQDRVCCILASREPSSSGTRIPQSGSRDHGRASHQLRRVATRSHHSS
jgi:hypothetical protein